MCAQIRSAREVPLRTLTQLYETRTAPEGLINAYVDKCVR